jgi:hypothetical protein
MSPEPEGALRSAILGFHLQVLGKDGGVPDVVFEGLTVTAKVLMGSQYI